MTLPPAPRASAISQTYRYVLKPYELMDECKAECGEIFRIRILSSGEWIFLSTPEHLKEMFTGPSEVLHAGEANAVVFGPVTGGHTMFTLDEGPHLRQRKLLQPPLHGERMQVYADIMREITEEQMNRWPRDRPFELHGEMQQIALQVILRAIFGLTHGARAGRLGDLLNQLANMALGSPLILVPALQVDLGRYSPWGKIMRVRSETDVELYAEISARRANKSELNAREDILSLLLLTKDEEGQPLSDVELRDELTTMLLAGHETTATSLAWMFERVLSLPHVYEKLIAELDAVVHHEPLRREHLPKLEYLDAVIKESMRLRPIAPNLGLRLVKKDFQVGGYTIPAGMTITNCTYLAHRRPEAYSDPLEFKPERFMGAKPDPFEWTPFGGGVRRCIGAAFALFEMKIVAATVLEKLVLRLPKACPPIRRGAFMAPARGLPVEVARAR